MCGTTTLIVLLLCVTATQDLQQLRQQQQQQQLFTSASASQQLQQQVAETTTTVNAEAIAMAALSSMAAQFDPDQISAGSDHLSAADEMRSERRSERISASQQRQRRSDTLSQVAMDLSLIHI